MAKDSYQTTRADVIDACRALLTALESEPSAAPAAPEDAPDATIARALDEAVASTRDCLEFEAKIGLTIAPDDVANCNALCAARAHWKATRGARIAHRGAVVEWLETELMDITQAAESTRRDVVDSLLRYRNDIVGSSARRERRVSALTDALAHLAAMPDDAAELAPESCAPVA